MVLLVCGDAEVAVLGLKSAVRLVAPVHGTEREREVDLGLDFLQEVTFWDATEKLTTDVSEQTFELALAGNPRAIDRQEDGLGVGCENPMCQGSCRIDAEGWGPSANQAAGHREIP